MARREITEAEQQRLDRYKQRRDDYMRQLAALVSTAPDVAQALTASRQATDGDTARWEMPGAGAENGPRHPSARLSQKSMPSHGPRRARFL